MDLTQRKALSALKFNAAPVPDDVWRTSPFHVDSLHPDVLEHILDGFDHDKIGDDGNPLGIVVQGIAGSGKSHLLGWVRERTQASGGYFFLISLLDGALFWKSAALAIIDGLQRRYLDKHSQLTVFLDRLCRLLDVSDDTATAVTGKTPVTREQLREFTTALSEFDDRVSLTCDQTARAMILLASPMRSMQDIGYTYLQSLTEMNDGERRTWGIHPDAKLPHQIVKEMSQLLALTGTSVIAIDEIDTLIAQAATSTKTPAAGESSEQTALINQIADGLLTLRNTAVGTLTVVTCLPSTWTLLSSKSAKSFRDRFHPATTLAAVPSAPVALEILAKRFHLRFEQVGFTPPHATWPIKPEALNGLHELTPRALISRVNAHIRACLQLNVVIEMTDWNQTIEQSDDHKDQPAEDGLDRRFAALKSAANVAAATGPDTEDVEMCSLLEAGLTAWIQEIGPQKHEFTLDSRQSGKYPLHARLRQVLDSDRDDEQHWSFRAICHSHGNAILPRIQAARTSAGLSKGITKRKLVLLRNIAWNKGARNQQVLQEFTTDGGITLNISDGDLRTFAALRQMLTDQQPGLEAWLQTVRPAGNTTLLRTVLGEVAAAAGTDSAPQTPGQSLFESVRPIIDNTFIAIGGGVLDDKPLRIEIESLRKHTAIFAGSGSGKTVLIRRLIEECALRGVSTIVLDPNNDLARLGDAWPTPPPSWPPGDASLATDYLHNTDVVIWTPRRQAGRPLSFQPLPNFHGVLNDPDELASAIDAAVASLAPRAKVDGNTAKAVRGQAVLNEGLVAFARQRGDGIKAFIGYLTALPEGVSQLEDAEKIAFEMSQNLTAAMVTDPLFGGGGAPADPGDLLTPKAGKRARISVISFVGLPSEQQRQSFVNQLQMALFAWIKQNPANDRPLGGLLVMDEAQTLAPSGAMTACTASTLALASQARKYGLGLVFATQAPKGLHNRISGNAATQFYGLLNAPAQIDAAREMARAKGGDITDISRLSSGQFYASGDGFQLRKVQMPLCLSHHPASPLTAEEVIQRAQEGPTG
ncbi:MAG TPA: AAA family ATPase [Micromonosporaceae bacterium]|nr:AAA family ATPase [Micromonosporaceae bacterium]HCU49615.1 AAA family ATPase [Micromonosporaceae bacterium]